MKKYKMGFSLAELLIALAIISIVAVMGFSITKKSTEKAYNMYIYNGYNSIQMAIADAADKNYTFDSCPTDINLEINRNKCPILKHIEKLLEANDMSDPSINHVKDYITPNNTIFSFEMYNGSDASKPYLCKIHMLVPSARYKTSITTVADKKLVTLYLVNGYPILIPASEVDPIFGGKDILVQDRIDLLPFYIEDGIVGRIISKYDENEDKILQPEVDKYEPRSFLSFRKAFCLVHGPLSSGPVTVDCSDIQNSGSKADTGVLKVVDPNKVF